MFKDSFDVLKTCAYVPLLPTPGTGPQHSGQPLSAWEGVLDAGSSSLLF
jgi:hypothetical protein